MRLSVDQSDPGYAAYEQVRISGQDVTILLDGTMISCVQTADDQEGIVVVPSQDKSGRFVVQDDQVQMVTKRGAVTILLAPRTEN